MPGRADGAVNRDGAVILEPQHPAHGDGGSIHGGNARDHGEGNRREQPKRREHPDESANPKESQSGRQCPDAEEIKPFRHAVRVLMSLTTHAHRPRHQ